MLSAYYYYGLTDNVPDKIHLAVERDGTKIKDENVIEYFVPKGTGEIGVVNTVLHGMELRIFDKERLLIETMRMRTKMPYAVLEKEIERLDETQQNTVVLFVRFLLSQKAAAKSVSADERPRKYDFSDLIGKVKFDGDPVAYQRSLRDEW
jgi:hypothetical protein